MDEVIGMVRRMMEGIEVSEEALALEAIDQVGPGGHFLSEDHTRRHFRGNWFPNLLDRGSCAAWLAKGGKTLRQRANEKVRQILATHCPEPLPDGVPAQLAAAIARAEGRLGASGAASGGNSG